MYPNHLKLSFCITVQRSGGKYLRSDTLVGCQTQDQFGSGSYPILEHFLGGRKNRKKSFTFTFTLPCNKCILYSANDLISLILIYLIENGRIINIHHYHDGDKAKKEELISFHYILVNLEYFLQLPTNSFLFQYK